MGEHERWVQAPSGLLLNGVLPNEAACVMRELDSERWAMAEERTAKLIDCIQPNKDSEGRRSAVADYVQRLIKKCFPCQVFTFGSVPLKTYLPDGDIDLTAFSKNQKLKDTCAHQVRDMLEKEEKNENAEFQVKEVQYIQAEVKIIKCLVENIVVDISFNQLGGLCTLCFLDEVDTLINQEHLFKRSIILIKAWCYYESRILGAHHGLISTYALETLILYVFHVFNNSFAGPLEVLYRFLEFFSKFDWDNFCVSLWGPVPISALPDVTAEPPRKDCGDLLLSKLFLEACNAVYAVLPGGQGNQGQPFMSKHFNVIDPLRVNNNLGRSVSKGNFFRIRSAFSFGAKRLARLLDCPKEDLYYEVNQFFMNTWDRHGSGYRPDAPRNDLWHLRLSTPENSHESDNLRKNSSCKTSRREAQVDVVDGSSSPPSQHGNTRSQKTSVNPNNTMASDHTRREVGSNKGTRGDKNQRSPRQDNLVSGGQGRYLFARTHSSPELTDTYGDASSQGKRGKVQESGKSQISSSRLDNSRRKNLESDNFLRHGTRSSTDNPSFVRHTLSRQSLDQATNSNSASNNYHNDLGLGAVDEEFAPAMMTQEMHQEEQDLVNMMASTDDGFNGQVHVPLNLASRHIPLQIHPSILTSLGYAQRNLSGMVPTNIPLMESPWGTNMQFPQGLISSPLSLTQYFPGIGLTSNPEALIDENFGSMAMNPGEGDHDFWHEQERDSTSGFDLDNGSCEMRQSDYKQQSTSSNYNFIHSSCIGGSSSSSRVEQFTKEARGSIREDRVDNFPYQENRGTEVYFDDRIASSMPFPTTHTISLGIKTSSESSWEVSSSMSSNSTRETKGWRMGSSAVPSSFCGKGKSVSEHSFNQVGDNMGPFSSVAPEMTERIIGPQSADSLHVSRHHIPGFEPAQTSGSESLIPISPVLLGPGSQQRTTENSGVPPFTFYATGPPIPFITMLPVYNFPTETVNSDAATSPFSEEGSLHNSDSGQKFDPSKRVDQSKVFVISNSTSAALVEPLENKFDILQSDFASHWQNLQYGRFCQNLECPAPLINHSPIVVPPMNLQGCFPGDGPGRPFSANMNLFSQLLSCGPHLVPVSPLQSMSNRPAGAYQCYVDEIPRYRGGTGTYLPNPVPIRDRHSTNTRKGNYNYDRSDHHGNKDGNRNNNLKPRAGGCNNSRGQAEKLSSMPDRLAASENRTDRTWATHRPHAFPSDQLQNGQIHSNSIATESGSANVAYGMYAPPSNNLGGLLSNGPTIPSVVMLYAYDHNSRYDSADQLVFGSLGPVDFSGINEGSGSTGGFEDQRFHGSSALRSSPDKPSSPHSQRRN